MIFRIVDVFFQIYMILLFVRIMGSWFPDFQRSRWMQFVSFYTDPYLNLFRKIIPPIGMMDISPILAFLCLGLIEQGVKMLIAMLLR